MFVSEISNNYINQNSKTNLLVTYTSYAYGENLIPPPQKKIDS